MNASVQNMEEAANIASEFIYSLDNLPSEIAHLTAEIRHKESRSQELAQEIAKDSNKYVRYSIRGSMPSTPSSAPSPITNGRSTTPGPAKFAAISLKISQSYAEIDKLADEKIALAERICTLINSTKNRLDCDLTRVGVLQGEPIDTHAIKAMPLSASTSTPSFGGSDSLSALRHHNPISHISDILRGNLVNDAPSPLPSTSGGPSAPKRRKTTSTTIKLPSPAPTPVAATATNTHKTAAATYARSRLSRQIRQADLDLMDDLDDADGEDYIDGDVDGDGNDEEDNKIYCTCRKKSYGDMIACDNRQCELQWFHLGCVGLNVPVEGTWYCPSCRVNRPTAGRKGRKKREHT